MSEPTQTETPTVANDPPPLLSAVRVAVATRRNGRRRNEDAVGIAGWVLHGDAPTPLDVSLPVDPTRPAMIALADGMGGHAAGDLAAQVAADHLTRSVLRSADDLEAAFMYADEAIHAAATAERRGMGCTASAVLIEASGRAVVGNLGDVRVYRMVDGYLGQVTVDDRPVNEPGVRPTGAVTRWLGGVRRTVVQAHLYPIALQAGDRLVMCTDGLHDTMPLKEMQRHLDADAPVVAGALVAAAGHNDGDNATVVVVELCSHGDTGSSMQSDVDSDLHDRLPHSQTVGSALRDILSPEQMADPERSRFAPGHPERTRRGGNR